MPTFEQPPQVAVQSQLASVPNMPQVQGVASQAVDASRSVAPAIQATSFPGLLSSLWSGLGGLRGSARRASTPPPERVGHDTCASADPAFPPGRAGIVPTAGALASSGPDSQSRLENPSLGQIRPSGAQAPQTSAAALGGAADSAVPRATQALPQVPPPPGLQGDSVPGGAVPAQPGGTHGFASGSPALDALFLGMQQLQNVQLQQLRGKDSDAPEVVKPGTSDLPKLASPDPSTGSLDFQDWLQLVGGLMGDLSDTSGSWWAAVLQVSRDAYERWVVSSPIDRLRIQPDDRPELVEGKWSRVNARACVMLLSALDETVKADLIARKTTQVASQILFRLHTQYLPGGTAERTLVLSNLQHPTEVEDAASGVLALRAWGRWYQRCVDCGMNLPDPMVLVSALTSMTKPVLRREPEVTWRTELVKSTLQLHGRPSEEAVRSYHRHLLAEFETLAGATVPVKPDDAQTPQLKAVSANEGGERRSGAGGKTCKFFLSPKDCKFGPKCRYQHSMSELSYAERARKCLNCGSEAHRAKDCTAGKSPKPDAQAPLCQIPTAMQEPVALAASSTSSTSQPIVPATPVNMNMVAFMQEALKAIRQVETHMAAEAHTAGAAAKDPATRPGGEGEADLRSSAGRPPP